MKTIDMQLMRYLNLFERITKIRTKYCFIYNNNIIFLVEPLLVPRAVGESGRNVKKLSEILGKRIRIISIPHSERDIGKFILAIVSPLYFKSLEVTGESVVISADRQTKAVLIGRNKIRLEEIRNIIKQYFNKELRIV